MEKKERLSEKVVELPIGLIRSGKRYRNFKIRRIKARDRAEVLKQDRGKGKKQNMEKRFSMFLQSVVLEINNGEIPITEEAIRSLTICDRDFLLLEVHKISKGNKLEIGTKCQNPQCNCSLDLLYDLENDIDVKKISDEEIDGEKIEIFEDDLYYKYINKELGLKIDMCFPTIRLTEEVSEKNLSYPYSDWYTYSKCIKKWNDIDGENINVDFISDQYDEEISWLESQLRFFKPGPQFLHRMECEDCGHQSLINLMQSNFLFSLPI